MKRLTWPMVALGAFMIFKAGAGYVVRQRAETRRHNALLAAQAQSITGVDQALLHDQVASEIERARARADGGAVDPNEVAGAAYNAYARAHGLPPVTVARGGGFVVRQSRVAH